MTSQSDPGGSAAALEWLRPWFARFNRRVMVPLLRGPLGRWVGNPVLGWIALLTTTGRRTGQPRQTPLNYALLDGDVLLLVGLGTRSDWYRNLLADPRVRIALPGRTLAGTASVVTDPALARRAAIAVARNSGFALGLAGVNPLTASDARIAEAFAGQQVVRIRPDPAGPPARPGRYDPGGWAWLVPAAAATLTVAAAGRVARRGLTGR